uniref:Uncharacterized protein n=1 Tax=Triticum urartu TaxID=4572 RepID=A0A8R7UNM7_TRIUA
MTSSPINDGDDRISHAAIAKTHRAFAPPPSKRRRPFPSDPPRVNLSPPRTRATAGDARGGVAASSGHTRAVAVGLSWSIGRRSRLPLGFCPTGATSRNSPPPLPE